MINIHTKQGELGEKCILPFAVEVNKVPGHYLRNDVCL